MSQTFQSVANVGLGSARFWLVKQGYHLETTLIFAPPFLIYLHHLHAGSIRHIGLFGPRAPRKRKAGKSECCQLKTNLLG